MAKSATAARARGAEIAAEAPDFGKEYLNLLSLVERLHRLLLDVVKDEFERLDMLDINSVQALLLFNIGDDEVTAGELRTRGYYQGSNVSYNLKKLVEAGYLHHERSAVERRSVRIRLTDRGRFIHDTVSELFTRHAAELMENETAGSERLPEATRTLRGVERFWTDQIRFIY